MTLTVSDSRRRPAKRWLSAPAALCLIASLLFAAPLRLWGLAAPEPVFPLIAAFGWAALRPSILAPLVLLGMGLFLDVLWGGPLGVWPLCLLAAHAFALSVRRFLAGEDFVVLWVWFAAMCAVSFLVGAAALRTISDVWPALIGVGLQGLVSAALFPLAWRLIERYQVAEVRLR